MSNIKQDLDRIKSLMGLISEQPKPRSEPNLKLASKPKFKPLYPETIRSLSTPPPSDYLGKGSSFEKSKGLSGTEGTPRKKNELLTTIPGFFGKDSPITVIKGTQYNSFTDSDNSGNLFPNKNLKKDEKYGYYEEYNDQRVYYPKDDFWKELARRGATKSFKTSPTVSNKNGEYYHFVMNMYEGGLDSAVYGIKYDELDTPARGWVLQPSYYKTEGNQQVPYDDKDIDTRNEFDKFWDDYGTSIQIVGGLVIGAVTYGLGNLITAAILAEAGVVAAEGAILASEVATVVNAVNIGRRYAFALEVLLEGGSNVLIGMYEESRGNDPTLSYIFAVLPMLKRAPGFNKIFGKLNFTEEDSRQVLRVLNDFDGTNPHIIDLLPERGKEALEDILKASKNNPNAFKELFQYGLEIEAAKAARDNALSQNIIDKTIRLGKTVKDKLTDIGKSAGKELAVVGGLDLAIKGLPLAWENLQAAYKEKYNQPMPEEKIEKITDDVNKLPTEEEKIEYIEKLAQKIRDTDEIKHAAAEITSKPLIDKVKSQVQLLSKYDEFFKLLSKKDTIKTNLNRLQTWSGA